jgi:shikimate kinase
MNGMQSAPHLVLVGPMGAGKTTLGQRIASARGLVFVDLDREIETRAGADIPTIFAREGEAGFRRREREALAEALAGPGCVLATGGGAVLDADNRALMRERGFVVHLQIEVEAQLARLAGDRSRPLIAGDDREAVLRRLAAERAPLYAEVADLNFAATGEPPTAAAARLTDILEHRWRPAPIPAPTPAPDRP